MLTLWQVFLCVFGAGFIGGFLNAFMSDNRFVVPKSIANESGGTVLQPGILGNALIGAIAATVSWGIYGAQSSAPVGGAETYALPVSALAGAVMMGVGGGRWLSAQVDKTLLRAAAAVAASAHAATDEQVNTIRQASPAEALKAASMLSRPSPPMPQKDDSSNGPGT